MALSVFVKGACEYIDNLVFAMGFLWSDNALEILDALNFSIISDDLHNLWHQYDFLNYFFNNCWNLHQFLNSLSNLDYFVIVAPHHFYFLLDMINNFLYFLNFLLDTQFLNDFLNLLNLCLFLHHGNCLLSH